MYCTTYLRLVLFVVEDIVDDDVVDTELPKEGGTACLLCKLVMLGLEDSNSTHVFMAPGA